MKHGMVTIFEFPVETKIELMPSDFMELAIIFHCAFFFLLFQFFYHSFCDLLVHPNMMMDVGFDMYQTQ